MKSADKLKDEYNKICNATAMVPEDFAEALGWRGILLMILGGVAFALYLILVASDMAEMDTSGLLRHVFVLGLAIFADVILMALIYVREEKYNKKLAALHDRRDADRQKKCVELLKAWGIFDRNQLKGLIKAAEYAKLKVSGSNFSSGTLVSSLLSTGLSIVIICLEIFFHAKKDKLALDSVILGLVITFSLAGIIIAMTPMIKKVLGREGEKMDNLITMLYDILNFQSAYKQ